jgi:hypothetical protein
VELEHGDSQTNVTNNDMDLNGQDCLGTSQGVPGLLHAIGPTRNRGRCLLVIPALTNTVVELVN